MADNLTVTIGADSTKLRADLAKAQSALKEFSKELRAAADEARKTGQTEHLQLASARYEAAAASARRYATELRNLGKEHVTGALAVREMVHHVLEFARESGIALEGIKALRLGLAGFAATEVIRGLTAVADRINELVRSSKEIGASTGALQAWEKAVKSFGGTTEDARQTQLNVRKLFDETGKAARESGESVGQMATVVRGNMKDASSAITNFGVGAAEVLHGAKKEAVDFKNILGFLRVDRRTFGDSDAEFARFQTAIAQSVVRLVTWKRTTDADIASNILYGKSFREIGQAVTQLANSGDWAKFQKATGIVALTPAQEKAALAYANAIDDLTRSLQTFATVVGTAVLPVIASGLEGLTKSFEATQKEVEAIASFIEAAAEKAKAAWEFVKSIGQGAGPSASAPLPSANGGDVGDGGASAPLPAQAAGGYIRGAGSGTSDSILARLSNGEFVMRARAVQRLGVGFLQSLNNSYAMGGLVTTPRLAFAGGGLASASGGRPVHLHLGSQSFALHGSEGVVDALVSQSHWQQTRSAGVKPSWFAARPSGR